jgi:hypothetical protein
MAVYDWTENEVVCAVAGDIFLNRLYWATSSGEAEAIDFTTHSWFRLDGGPQPKEHLAGARASFLTTKVFRFCSVVSQQKLLNTVEEQGDRINLSWRSNMIIQVAPGYANAAVEFTKGFATYDVLPGLFIGLKSGLTILDPRSRQPIECKLDIDDIFASYQLIPIVLS